MLWKLLFLVSIIIGLGYPIWCIWYLDECSITLSSTWYDLQKKNDKLKWLFMVWSWGTCFTLAPLIFRLCEFDNMTSAFGCLTICALFMVGFYPRYNEHQIIGHCIGAGISAICAFIWACLLGYWFIPFCFLPVVFIGKKYYPSSIGYFIECLAFLSVYTIVGLNL